MVRRYTSKRDLAELMLRQDGKCRCGVKLIKGNYIIEHSTPLALGGLDVLENKYLNCKECADKKTHGGKSKATTAGTDIANIWKVKRLRGEVKGRPKTKWPIRKMESGPTKWPSRKFQKRVKQ